MGRGGEENFAERSKSLLRGEASEYFVKKGNLPIPLPKKRKGKRRRHLKERP